MWLRRRIQYIIPKASEEELRFHPLNLRSGIKESPLCMRRIYSRLLLAHRHSLFREIDLTKAVESAAFQSHSLEVGFRFMPLFSSRPSQEWRAARSTSLGEGAVFFCSF